MPDLKKKVIVGGKVPVLEKDLVPFAANCYALSMSDDVTMPLFSSGVSAGYPAVADNHVDRAISLNDLVRHPPASFLVRVQGYSMIDEGIRDGDMLVVDKSLDYRNNDIIVASLQGELTVKRLEFRRDNVRLCPANPEYPVIDITEEMDFQLLGVVTHNIHFIR
ncbi:MAG: LexA family protein [Rhodothermales bacterium]